MAAYGQAQALLAQAQGQLGQAGQLLSQSLSTEGAQTIGGVMRFGRRDQDGLVGNVANHHQKKQVHDAHELATAATRAIQQARATCPDLPHIHEPNVAELGGMIRQGIFDSTLMDAMRMGKLKESLAQIQRSAQDVGQAMAFCAGRAAAATAPGYGPSTPQQYGAPPPSYSGAPAAYGAPAMYGGPPAAAYGGTPAAYGAPAAYGPPAPYGAPAYGAAPVYAAAPAPYAAAPPPQQQHHGMGVGGALLAGAALAAGHDRREDRREGRRLFR